MSHPSSGRLDVAEAVQVLVAAGAVFSIPESGRSFGLDKAAEHIDVKPSWLKRHKDLIPGWWRLPAGSTAVAGPVGELRFPVSGLDAFVVARQKSRAA